jgi:hypothetical protein
VSEERKQARGSNFVVTYYYPYVTLCSLLRPEFLLYVENFRGTRSPDTVEVLVKCVEFLCVLSAKVCKPMCSQYLVSLLAILGKKREAILCKSAARVVGTHGDT